MTGNWPETGQNPHFFGQSFQQIVKQIRARPKMIHLEASWALIGMNTILSLGGLTLTWFTYMCLPFGVLFHEIWVFIRDDGAQIQKLGVF